MYLNDVFEQRHFVDYLIRHNRFSYLGNKLPVKLARQLSARNRLKGTITRIKKGGVVAGVEVKLDGTGDIVYSVITLEAVSGAETQGRRQSRRDHKSDRSNDQQGLISLFFILFLILRSAVSYQSSMETAGPHSVPPECLSSKRWTSSSMQSLEQ